MNKEHKAHIGIIVVAVLVLLLLLSGCKSKTVYIPVESIKTEYRDKLQRDSVHLYDSIYLEKYLKGDTVFLTKEKYKYLYRDKMVRDSVFKSDTIRVPYPVKGDTEYINQVKWYHEAALWFTSFVLAALALYLGIKYRGKIFSFFRKLIFKI